MKLISGEDRTPSIIYILEQADSVSAPCGGLSISHSSVYHHLVRLEEYFTPFKRATIGFILNQTWTTCPVRSTLHWWIKVLFLFIKKKKKNVFSCCDPIQLVFVALWFRRRRPSLLSRFPGHGRVTLHSYISYFHIKTI